MTAAGQNVQNEIESWAMARRRFLQEAYPKLYAAMEKAGTLEEHLEETGELAQEMFETTASQIESNALASKKPYSQVAESLQFAKARASEVVMHEVILVPPGR
jgi:hypothetical protein